MNVSMGDIDFISLLCWQEEETAWINIAVSVTCLQ